MARTESKIVQVAPTYENEKIREMEQFGWSLAGRQEIHEEGDAEGKPDLFGSGYTVTTKIKHYVKLHFTRDLDLPGLSAIKKIEQEVETLSFPSARSQKWPLVLLVLGVFGVVVAIANGELAMILVRCCVVAVADCGFTETGRKIQWRRRSVSEAGLVVPN